MLDLDNFSKLWRGISPDLKPSDRSIQYTDLHALVRAKLGYHECR